LLAGLSRQNANVVSEIEVKMVKGSVKGQECDQSTLKHFRVVQDYRCEIGLRDGLKVRFFPISCAYTRAGWLFEYES